MRRALQPSDFIPGGRYEPPLVGQPGGLLVPTIPTLSYSGGAGSNANLTLISYELTPVSSSLIAISMLFDWSAFGNTQFSLVSSAAGWSLLGTDIGFYRDGGAPISNPVNKFPDGCIFNAAATDHNIVVDCFLAKE